MQSPISLCDGWKSSTGSISSSLDGELDRSRAFCGFLARFSRGDSTPGCRDVNSDVTDFANPPFFTRLTTCHQLQLEFCRSIWIDLTLADVYSTISPLSASIYGLFDAANTASILPYLNWLLSNQWRRVRFSSFCQPVDEGPPSTIRTSFQVVITPIRCAESNRTLQFAISPLVGAL